MKAWPARLSRLVVTSTWLVGLACLVGTLWIDQRLEVAGRADLTSRADEAAPLFVVALLISLFVGSVLVLRRPEHPVGWLFLGLGVSIYASGALQAYASYGAIARPGALPAASLAAVVADGLWVPWLVLIALVLLLTPTGAPPSPRWRFVRWMALGGAVPLVIGILLSTEPLSAPFEAVRNPWAQPDLEAPVAFIRAAGAYNVMGSFVLGAVSLIVRFWRARGVERQQLKWMAIAAVPLTASFLVTWYASRGDHPLLLGVSGAAMVAILPIAAGLAVSQYHLYEVDRLLSRALTYTLLTALVVGSYAGVVLVAGIVLSEVQRESQLTAVIATLVAASVAWPARVRLQDALDRRFNRREFEAISRVRSFVRDPSPSATVEDTLREALADPTLDVSYWMADRELWVTQDGQPTEPREFGIEVRRGGARMAAISYDPANLEQHVVVAVAAEARPELENARLRAAIALQLVEVRESRARIVEAQAAERRKIERNLHDGAQQRLLGLAFQMRAAEISGDGDRALEVLGGAVHELQQAVLELRDLANGLHPAILHDGGLVAAFDELAAHTPLPMAVTATDERFPPGIEATAWFIACEAVANVVKHAHARRIEVGAQRSGARLVITVADDGVGGADPAGSGLRGIADRAEAAGGSLLVGVRPGGGTLVRSELPCAS